MLFIGATCHPTRSWTSKYNRSAQPFCIKGPHFLIPTVTTLQIPAGFFHNAVLTAEGYVVSLEGSKQTLTELFVIFLPVMSGIIVFR